MTMNKFKFKPLAHQILRFKTGPIDLYTRKPTLMECYKEGRKVGKRSIVMDWLMDEFKAAPNRVGMTETRIHGLGVSQVWIDELGDTANVDE